MSRQDWAFVCMAFMATCSQLLAMWFMVKYERARADVITLATWLKEAYAKAETKKGEQSQ